MSTTTSRLWAPQASGDYVAARTELARAENDLIEQAERVAAMRRALPPGPVVPDYAFDEGPRDLSADGPVRRTRLSELVREDRPAVVYHLMLHPDDAEACPMCSLWVDGLHGVSHHLARHVELAIVAKAPLSTLRAWGRRRGWDGLRLLSSHGGTFNADLDVEDAGGAQKPAMSVFVHSPEGMRHAFNTRPDVVQPRGERGMDMMNPVWAVLDLLPSGRGEWYAGNDYAGRSRG
jgi:predicted dithiol-disulfide oxidoreductase (DUF899 family)